MSAGSSADITLATLSCQSDKASITVGEHMALNCTGDLPSGFMSERSDFKLQEHQKYHLKLFKFKTTEPAQHSLDFTIYFPGDYKISDMIITDGTGKINLTGAGIKVESVIKPPNDGKPPEPFGFLLPITITTPVYYYLVFVAAILSSIIYSIFKLKRLSYYKKLKEKLKTYNSPVAADTQFYKSIRTAEKAEYPLEQIEQAFRLYNLRSYQLPMFDLPNERISKYFKHNFPQYKNTRLHLMKLLEEFEEMQKKKDLLSLSDKQEFVKKLYRYVESHKGIAE